MNTTRLRLTLLQKNGEKPAAMALGESIETLLEPSRPVIIGRIPSVDVVVAAPSVGRQVAGLTLRPDGVWVQDLGSGGGSSLEFNGVVTHRPNCPLPNPAILRIGQVAFRVELVCGA